MGLLEQAGLTASLAMPAIMSQLSTILMQYIDAAMVGRLGATASASVGLMNSSLWLFTGVLSMAVLGFTVQVAQRLGASDVRGARQVVRESLLSAVIMGTVMSVIALAIGKALPRWLGGHGEVAAGASDYFMIISAALPIYTMNYLSGGMLRCAGNMKIPSLFNVLMCLLDVVFNWFLIFPSRTIDIFGSEIQVWGAGMGIRGAALGTVLATALCAVAMTWYLLCRQHELKLTGHERGSFMPSRAVLRRAFQIGSPMSGQQAVFCGAQMAVTAIVAPLGPVAIAANAFAVTAESLCYMPGFGIADAATTLCGQAVGARRPALVRRFGWLSTGLGMAVMSFMGILLYFGAPLMMGILSPVREIVDLGTEVLRIEAFAEPMYAASIVAYGAFVGVGDTLIPAVMNFGSIWCVRVPLAAIMAPIYGLRGVWMAMCFELIFRGIIFLLRMKYGRWIKI